MIIGEKAGVPAVGIALTDSPTDRVRAAARRGPLHSPSSSA